MIRPLPDPVVWTLGGVFFALAMGSLIAWALQAKRPQKDYTELRARMKTWWVIVILFSLALVTTRGMGILFFVLVSFLALREYISLMGLKGEYPMVIWAYLAIPIQYLFVYFDWYGMFIIFIPVYLLLILPTRAVMAGKTEGFIRTMSTMHWGLMITVFSISHACYLLVLSSDGTVRQTATWPGEDTAASPGPGLLICLVLLTQLNDVAQFIWGKSFGRRRVAPAVSPGKTWAGLIGGVATTVLLAAILAPQLTLMNWKYATLAGLIIGLGGFAGDLSISALKRDLGVKDSGTTLPGHGGILDRVDSLTYTAPLFFHFIRFLYY